MKTTPGCTVGVLLHCVSTVLFYTKSSSHEVSVGYKLVFAILSYNKAFISVTLFVEIQHKGFTSHKAKSPLQFEVIFYALRLSLTFRC